MTQIPATSLSASLTPVQRQQNDSLRARQVQSAKALHHNEDVEELDDTGVDSIRDDGQGGGHQQQQENAREQAEDKVEIQNLDAAPPAPPKPSHPLAVPLPSLDISA
ncbi:MAG: hypothetical protein ACTHN5_09745 [Phycisphaerae bacterium]